MSRILARRYHEAARRLFSTAPPRAAFATGPAPPLLPPKEQAEFERLQASSTGAFSTPRPSVVVNQPSEIRKQQEAQAAAAKPEPTSSSLSSSEIENAAVDARVNASGKGEELHPDIRRGAKPEFEGERNPKTGESGGPKNEPIRWGSSETHGDWSYNGRVTDF